MEDDEYYGDVFSDPPITPLFLSTKPKNGYTFVHYGDIVPKWGNECFSWKTTYAYRLLPKEKREIIDNKIRAITAEEAEATEEIIRNKLYGSKEVGYVVDIDGPLLLMPISSGFKYEWRNVFIDEEKPLFQQFADIHDDKNILDFANKYGYLHHKPIISFNSIGAYAKLESTDFWKQEIALINKFLQIWGDCEDNKPVGEYIEQKKYEKVPGFRDYEEKRIFFYINVERPGYVLPWSNFVDLPYIMEESERDTVFRALAAFLDMRIAEEFPMNPQHVLQEDGTFKSYLIPQTLLGAIWLNLSQTFFKDGDEFTESRRSFLTGIYYFKKYLSKRTCGKHSGKYYHEKEKCKFRTQKNNIKKAEAEGRTIKPDRKGKTKFIVDEF